MPELKLYLFGTPRIERNGETIVLSRRKVMAMLVYLVVTRQTHRRDTLASLFWPESGQKSARTALRRELHLLQQAIDNDWIEATRDTVEVRADANMWIDVDEFRRLTLTAQEDDTMAVRALSQAAVLYQGDFLAGFTLSDCPEFDDWQFFEADALRREYAVLLEKLVGHFKEENAFEEAVHYARKWLSLDPMHEPVHRELMRLFALAGQYAAAVRQYDECIHILDEELGMPPEGETKTLFEAIRTRKFSMVDVTQLNGNINEPSTSSRSVFARRTDHAPLWVGVPPLPSAFLGRYELLTEIVGQVKSNRHTAFAITGLPGIGKTTLAAAIAHHPEVLTHFADGVLWAGAGPEADLMSLLAYWARALNVDVAEIPDLEMRAKVVQQAVGQRRLLLVIDDVWKSEVGDLLRCGGPFCCYILTTRDQAIARSFSGPNHVWSVPVLTNSSACQLIREIAPEAWAADPDGTSILVNSVGQLPLAVTLLGGYLAAPERSYFSELSKEALSQMQYPHERLKLAQKRLGSLAGEAVSIEESIALSLEGLSNEAVLSFYALGAFAPNPEQFSREAAMAIVEADLETLTLLVARNLVEIGQDGELSLHQVVADFARTHTVETAIQRHRSYYLTVVNQDSEDWQRIESLYGQINWAWRATSDDEQLMALLKALGPYQHYRGMWNDRIRWHKCLSEIPGEREEEHNRLLDLGMLYQAQERWDEALRSFQEGLTICRQRGNRHGESYILNSMGLVYVSQKEWVKAIETYMESRAICRQRDDIYGECHTINNLGITYREQQLWKEATELFEQNLVLYRQLEDSHWEGLTLTNIGIIYEEQQQWEAAIMTFQEALALGRQTEDAELEGYTLFCLGRLYVKQSHWQKAVETYHESLEKYQHLGYVSWASDILTSLGRSYEGQERWDKAVQAYSASLDLKRQLGKLNEETQILSKLNAIHSARHI